MARNRRETIRSAESRRPRGQVTPPPFTPSDMGSPVVRAVQQLQCCLMCLQELRYGRKLMPGQPAFQLARVNCALGVEREISISSGVISAGTLANSGVLR